MDIPSGCKHTNPFSSEGERRRDAGVLPATGHPAGARRAFAPRVTRCGIRQPALRKPTNRMMLNIKQEDMGRFHGLRDDWEMLL